SPGRINERDDRQAETVGYFHDADRLAIAFRPRASEIVLQPRLRVMALFLADDRHGLSLEAGKAGLDCCVLAESPVAGKRREVGEELGGVIHEMRSLRMARDLGLLPGVELGIDLFRRLADANLQPGNLVGGIDALVFRG